MTSLRKAVLLLLYYSFLCLVSGTEALAYEHSFHKKIVEMTFDMKREKYPDLSSDPLLEGSVQPDHDRSREPGPLGNLLGLFRNPEHKRDATLISTNYVNAVSRFNSMRSRDPAKALNEALRILAKAFHFVSDQTELPARADKRFSEVFDGESFRSKTQKLLSEIKDKESFYEKVSRRQSRFGHYNPGDSDQMRKIIAEMREELEKDIDKIISGHSVHDPQAKIEGIIAEGYLPDIVAVQNFMLDQFFKEIKSGGIFGPSGSEPCYGPADPPCSGDDWEIKCREDADGCWRPIPPEGGDPRH